MPRISDSEHETLRTFARQCGLSKPPRRPIEGECCDRGCGLCIWDYYEIMLRRWRKTVGLPEDARLAR